MEQIREDVAFVVTFNANVPRNMPGDYAAFSAPVHLPPLESAV